jgi:poly(3-hydroxybutyrate) depolymerase
MTKWIAALSVSMLIAAPAAPPKIERLPITSGGKLRTYYWFLPPTQEPVPLLILLHGSGRNGQSLADPWKKLAEQEAIALAAPDSLDNSGWAIPEDGPYFLYELIETIKSEHEIDPRRVYLFGHSAGAIQALQLSLVESEYFAATAVHAGALPVASKDLLTYASRKIPLAIWVGTHDPLFPLTVVRATRDTLKAGGFPVELTEVKGHTHAYYARASEINTQVWAFLKQHRLASDPYYRPVVFGAKPGGIEAPRRPPSQD